MEDKQLPMQSLVAFADRLTIVQILRLSAGVAVVVGVVVFLLAPLQYTANCTAMFSQRPDIVTGLGLGPAAGSPLAMAAPSPMLSALDPGEKWTTALLKSRVIRQRVIRETGLSAALEGSDPEEVLQWLGDSTTIKPLQKGGALGGAVGLTVQVTCPGPARLLGWLGHQKPFTTTAAKQMAASLANAYFVAVNNHVTDSKIGAASDMRRFIEKRQVQVKADLNRVETELQRFRTEHMLMAPESRGTELSTSMASLTEELARYRADEQERARSLQAAQAGLSRQQASKVLGEVKARNPVITSLDEQLSALRLQIAVAQAEGKGPAHPDVVALQSGIREAQAQIAAMRATIFEQVTSGTNPLHADLLKQVIELQVSLAGLRARLTEREAQLRRAKTAFAQLPPLARQYAELLREQTVLTNVVTALRQRLEIATIEERQEKVGKVEVLDQAVPPTHKSGPSAARTAVMAFMLVAIVLGAALAWRRGLFAEDAAPSVDSAAK